LIFGGSVARLPGPAIDSNFDRPIQGPKWLWIAFELELSRNFASEFKNEKTGNNM